MYRTESDRLWALRLIVAIMLAVAMMKEARALTATEDEEQRLVQAARKQAAKIPVDDERHSRVINAWRRALAFNGDNEALATPWPGSRGITRG